MCRILLVSAVVLLSFCSVAQASLILDGGFEESPLGGPPSSPWDSQAGRRLVVVNDQSGLVYEGDQALLLTDGPGKSQGPGVGNVLRQTVTGLTVGKTYTVSAWVNITDFDLRTISKKEPVSIALASQDDRLTATPITQDDRLSITTTSQGVRLSLMDDETVLASAATGAGLTHGWVQLSTDALAPASGELTVQIDEYGKHTLRAFIDDVTIPPAPIPEPQAAFYIALTGLLLLVRRPTAKPAT